MLIWEVAKKYAHAAFMSAKDRGVVDEAEEQMLALKELIAADDNLLDFLTMPKVPEDRKLALVSDVFGPRMNRLLVEFLLLLVRKRRINYLPEIIEEFDREVKAEKGVYRVTAISAVALTGGEERTLIDRLSARFSASIELEKKVNASIIGGMIVITHNEIIDGSVQHGLNELKGQLAQVRVH
jgi:F-type H+-transporting ATPase subunit delta